MGPMTIYCEGPCCDCRELERLAAEAGVHCELQNYHAAIDRWVDDFYSLAREEVNRGLKVIGKRRRAGLPVVWLDGREMSWEEARRALRRSLEPGAG